MSEQLMSFTLQEDAGDIQKINAFMERLKNGEIPDRFPHLHSTTFYYNYKDDCNAMGMWGIVDKQTATKLASIIGQRSVLEVMAGVGWLAKALSEQGVNIKATDNLSWQERHNHTKIHRVYRMRAETAVKKHGHKYDILLVSWPPHGNEDFVKAAELWGPNKDIIFIGEGEGGCTGSDKFWWHFKIKKTLRIPHWPGIHDYCYIGRYNEPTNKKSLW